MMSSMRQWRRLVLVGMLAWVVLFLALLSYFLDARVDEPLTSAGSLLSQHPDTRRLASLQVSQLHQAMLGSRPELALALTTASSRGEPEPKSTVSSTTPESSLEASRSPNSAPYANYGSQEADQKNYLDPQSLAAWSSFGTENVGSNLDPSNHSREKTSQIADDRNFFGPKRPQSREEENYKVQNEVRKVGMRRRIAGPKRLDAYSSDLGEQYFSRSSSVVQQLWRGRVSADMLSPRLQRAMKEYMNANKHHVFYTGQRSVTLRAKELLCQMKTKARLKTVDGSEEPFSSLGWAQIVPSLPLEELYRQQGKNRLKTCAVVTSAGAILRSRLGKEIGE